MSPIQWIHWKTPGDGEKINSFPVHYKSLTGKESQLLLVSDWVDSLIGPIGLLLGSSLPPTYYSQFQFYGWGWKKVPN
jgi:hypothetical protein